MECFLLLIYRRGRCVCAIGVFDALDVCVSVTLLLVCPGFWVWKNKAGISSRTDKHFFGFKGKGDKKKGFNF